MNSIKIKIVGDSIAAGIGSSQTVDTADLIFEDDGKKYFKKIAPNAWWGLLEKYFKEKNMNCIVRNVGAGGAFSYQINQYFDQLISEDDDLILLLFGLNNRKLKNGMSMLVKDYNEIIKKIINSGKMPVILTPTPSDPGNEYYPNRIYHTEEVVKVIRDTARHNNVYLIDIYSHIEQYLINHQLKIEDTMYEKGCTNDGLHPSDSIQKLMFEKVIEALEEILHIKSHHELYDNLDRNKKTENLKPRNNRNK